MLHDKFKKLSPCFYILLPSSPPQRHLLNERRPKSSLTLLSLFLNFPKRKQTVQGRGRTDDVEVANFFFSFIGHFGHEWHGWKEEETGNIGNEHLEL